MKTKNQKAIICVDDDPFIVNQLEESFNRSLGDEFVIEVAESANELLDIIRSLEDINIDTAVIVSDYLMPKINGLELIEIINKKYPFIKIVLLTGNMNLETLENVINNINIYKFIKKPWQEDYLVKVVREAAAIYKQSKEWDELVDRLRRSEVEKRLILDSISEAIFYLDNNLKVLWSNPVAKEFLGREPEGLHCKDMFHRLMTPCENCCGRQALDGNKNVSKEVELEDGRHLFLRFYVALERGTEAKGVVLSIHDITQRKRIEKINLALLQLAKANNKLETVEELYDNSYKVVTELLHLFQFAIVGYEEHALYVEYQQGKHLDQEAIHNRIQEHASYEHEEDYFFSKDSHSVTTFVEPICFGKYIIVSFKENGLQHSQIIDLLSAVVEQLKTGMTNIYHLSQVTYQANHDALTGLYNRKYFIQKLEGSLKSLRMKPDENMHYSIAMIDLNRFKLINDQFGHVAGDEVLRCISHKMLDATRHEDVLARIGGDEFALIFMCSVDEEVENMLTRIQESVYLPISLNHVIADSSQEVKVQISASIGAIKNIEQFSSLQDVLRAVDSAMYHAKEKKQESGEICFYEEEKEAIDV